MALYALNFEKVDSNNVKLFYSSFDPEGTEKIKLDSNPASVLLDYKPLKENTTGEGYSWKPLENGGLLTVRRVKGNKVIILK